MAISPVLSGFGWFHRISRVKLPFAVAFIVPLNQPITPIGERETRFLLFFNVLAPLLELLAVLTAR